MKLNNRKVRLAAKPNKSGKKAKNNPVTNQDESFARLPDKVQPPQIGRLKITDARIVLAARHRHFCIFFTIVIYFLVSVWQNYYGKFGSSCRF